MTTPLSVQAIAAAGRWTRLVQGHIPLAGLSCMCSAGFEGISVADFEQDVLDYLFAKHGADPALAVLFAQAGCSAEGGGSVLTLLQTIAQARQHAPGASRLLTDLDSSLRSFEESHAGTTATR
ncbi:hypothetical protein [Pigmentiphaga litoralis]|uniref:Uncharacterized protein n=1 Tax=Pigmentiphaga litoralis TaxID=516702 RepID=A0A7Y9IRB3_9BURK|nr:hypothetical protein [Pigmentiphaga litoralis]NYE24828.1 hypothetical protein [Pigmentiphaga litoralis]NYE81558.1 hypothetical protein [Pigmentiphaga litoralis]